MTNTTNTLHVTYHDLTDRHGDGPEVLGADRMDYAPGYMAAALLEASKLAGQTAYANDVAYVIRDAAGSVRAAWTPLDDPGYRKWMEGTGCQECDGEGCTECTEPEPPARKQPQGFLTTATGMRPAHPMTRAEQQRRCP